MVNFKLGNKNVDLNKLFEGLSLDKRNLFLKKYDTNGDSIFSKEELKQFQIDLIKAAGKDKILSNDEILNLYAKKMGVSMQVAKQKFAKYGNIVLKAVEYLNDTNNTKIVKDMGDVIDDNWQMGSLDTDKFNNAYNKINSDNVVDILKAYRKRFDGENLPTAMMRERSSKNGLKIQKVKELYQLLYNKIDKHKFSTTEIEKTFNEFLKQPLVDKQIDKLDKIFDTMIAMVEGSNVKGYTSFEQATGNVKQRNAEAQKVANNKAETQGGISRVLDDIAGFFGGMTKEEVDNIIKTHEKEIAQLEKLKNNEAAYRKEFQRIFGIEYKPSAIANYNKIQAKFTSAEVQNAHAYEILFNSTFENELEKNDIENIYIRNGISVVKNKFDNLYKKACNFLGKELVDNYLKAAGAEKQQITSQYTLLYNLLKEQAKLAKEYTINLCGGMEYSELEKSRNDAYHAAYGLKKDSYLAATDWVKTQNTRLATAQMTTQIAAMAGAMFTGGGSLALLSTAVLLTDPVSFTERATDVDGMTKDDWSNFMSERAETLGWMILGMGAGAVGQAASNMVKMKGLSHLMKQSGKSLDDLIKNPNLPNNIKAQIINTKKMADAIGISTEVAVDITTTALLQKDGATTGDWIMSISGAIIGTKFQNKLANMPEPDAIKQVQSLFPDLKINNNDALKIVRQVAKQVQKANKKAQKWANTPTKRSGNMYSSIVPVSPEMATKAAKAVTRVATKVVDTLLKNIEFKNYLNKTEEDLIDEYFAKQMNKHKDFNENYKFAVKDALNEIAHRIANGEYPSKEMKKQVLNDISKLYSDLDPEDLLDYFDVVTEETLRSKGWDGIGECMMNSEKWGKEAGYVEDTLEPFKEERGWNSKSESPKEVEKTSETLTPKVETEDKKEVETPSKNPNNDPPQIETSNDGAKNLEFDKLYDKYPEVGETSFFDSESREKALQLMEEYPDFVEQNGITMENFHEMETIIYQKMSDLGINDSDWDRVMKLIKERYHQDVISNDTRVKEINNKFKIDEEAIKVGDKLIKDLKAKMQNGEKIDEYYIRNFLEENHPNKYDTEYERIENYIYSHEDVNNYINDCTHKDIYENPDYKIYSQETKRTVLEVFDSMLDDIKNGKELTVDLIKEYQNHPKLSLVEFGQEFFIELIKKHNKTSQIYPQLE